LPRICDYEGSRYRSDFWVGQNREYEDRVERIAIQKLLPPHGERLIEVGAGFGRLADLYRGYKQVVLTDYARTQLEAAQDYLGDDDRFIYVVADVYNMPFVDNLFDTLTIVRVMHHLAEVPTALSELHRIMVPKGTALIEFASKFHLKSIVRWLLRRQNWNPIDRTPLEFVELNFNFHPSWMRQQLQSTGFQIKNIHALSHFRLDWLKRLLPTSLLVTLDGWAQPTGNWWQLTPSLLLKAQAQKAQSPLPVGFFRCPSCKSSDLTRSKSEIGPGRQTVLICENCQCRWSYRDGIYDFKTPLLTGIE
jgi:ubiquinone/menaquinone biosynthesis C-methylase UbiE